MHVRVNPGASISGELRVPGDKSIAHRWLILASTARGRSRISGLPGSLDVRATASCLSRLAPRARPALEVWTEKVAAFVEGGGSTWNPLTGEDPVPVLEVEGEGRAALVEPSSELDCRNSGTSMRLLTGLLAGSPFTSVLTGDQSLSARPMERVAEPLRLMGADVETVEGHAPITLRGGRLHGIDYELPVPSAQVKSAILLAGLAAEGTTSVVEPVATRDHTERALASLGVPVLVEGRSISLAPASYEGFQAGVPGDPSSAAFLIAAAALTGSEVSIRRVGLNPSRLAFLAMMERMGVPISTTEEGEEIGEPTGRIDVGRTPSLLPLRVSEDELPLVIDEVPVLAAMAVFAGGDSWFLGARELRVKESDRLSATADGIRGLGGEAATEGDDLVIAGGGLDGGTASSGGDHRLAMAFVVASLAARSPSIVHGVEAADVSFPGFVQAIQAAGADLEVLA